MGNSYLPVRHGAVRITRRVDVCAVYRGDMVMGVHLYFET